MPIYLLGASKYIIEQIIIKKSSFLLEFVLNLNRLGKLMLITDRRNIELKKLSEKAVLI